MSEIEFRTALLEKLERVAVALEVISLWPENDRLQVDVNVEGFADAKGQIVSMSEEIHDALVDAGLSRR